MVPKKIPGYSDLTPIQTSERKSLGDMAEEFFERLRKDGKLARCSYIASPLEYALLGEKEVRSISDQVLREYISGRFERISEDGKKEKAPAFSERCMVFVKEGKAPKEFEDLPKAYYDITAHYTSIRDVDGQAEAFLDTSNRIVIPEIAQRFVNYLDIGLLLEASEWERSRLMRRLSNPVKKLFQEKYAREVGKK